MSSPRDPFRGCSVKTTRPPLCSCSCAVSQSERHLQLRQARLSTVALQPAGDSHCKSPVLSGLGPQLLITCVTLLYMPTGVLLPS